MIYTYAYREKTYRDIHKHQSKRKAIDLGIEYLNTKKKPKQAKRELTEKPKLKKKKKKKNKRKIDIFQ